MENRVGLKILTLLLVDGLSHAKDGSLYGAEFPDSVGKRIEKFVTVVETYLNKKVLGTPRNPAHWQLPLEGDNVSDKKIGTICLCNNRTRKVVEDLWGLVQLCEPNSSRRTLWKESVIDNYVPAFKILRWKCNLSDEDIAAFQRHVDVWFQLWTKLHPGDLGITNYIHLLASGHIAEYLKYWRSLYPHSQQGWGKSYC
jgi:hypothetical protein